MVAAVTDEHDSPDRMRARIDALCAPGAICGGEVAQCIETHVSWVLLCGDRAYKFKKPLDLGFLDFSTRAQRLRACEEELRLNRRTLPEAYLDLVALGGSADAPALVPWSSASGADDGRDDLPEPGVRMRRFDAGAVLDDRLARGALDGTEIDALAYHVAAFHAAAAVADPRRTDWGAPRGVREAALQNFEQMQSLNTHDDAGDPLQRLRAWTAEQSVGLEAVFARRRERGRVRECHGDLHLGNIVLFDGAPRLFDAIEFSPALRWTDVAADIAFLVMDLLAHGRDDLGWRFLNGWLEHSGDYEALMVLDYYLVYRAMVRAKVALIRATQSDGAARDAMRAELHRYLALGERLATPCRPALLIACGLSGAGKTSQSQGLLEARGVVRVRADVERKRLFGLAPLMRSTESAEAGGAGGDVRARMYDDAANERTYARLAEVAETGLRAGWTVLVDATFLQRARRERFRTLAAQMGVGWGVLCFEAPLDVLRARVARRHAEASDASEADETVLMRQRTLNEPLGTDEARHALRIDTTQAVCWDAAMLARVDALIRYAGPEHRAGGDEGAT